MPRAIVCTRLGPPEALELVSLPRAALGDGEVRVAVRAAGLNFPDVLMIEGQYQFKPTLPFVPGMEAAGEVLEVAAGVSGLRPGDRVVAKLRHGAFSEEIVVAARQLAPLPEGFDDAEGATFSAAHGTAYYALTDRAHIAPGEVLLVHGAGGGVGLAAVELGKILGATVIAAASTDEKLSVARARGADHTLRYGDAPLREAVKAITDGRGADVVFDPVGGTVFEESLRCIAWGARLLVIGFAGGIGMAATNLVLIKGATVLGVRAGEAARRDPARGLARQQALWELARQGRVRPHISHRVPFEEAARAMRLLTERRTIGRVALMMPS
jgi:NADPH2:quinone reductase